MTIYSYRSTMPGTTDTIEGIVITKGIPLVYSVDQPILNKYVPSRLDRLVDGVLANSDLVLPDIITAQEVADLKGMGVLTISATDSTSSMTAAQLMSTKALVSVSGVSSLLVNGSAGTYGTLICGLTGATFTNSDTTRAVRSSDTRDAPDLFTSGSPDKTNSAVIRLQGNGNTTVTYREMMPVGVVDNTVRSIGVWCRALPRSDGQDDTEVRLQMAQDNAGAANFSVPYAQFSFPIVADGKWRFYTFSSQPAPGFISQNPDVFVPGTGAVLRWIGFSTSLNSECAPRVQLATGDYVEFGAVYVNPRGAKAAAIIRFDDSLTGFLKSMSANAIWASAFPSGYGPTQGARSGVNISLAQGNAMNPLDLIAAFGFKASHFILTDYVGRKGFATWDELRSYQSVYGNMICYQTKANQTCTYGLGVRMLGPIGVNICPAGKITAAATTVLTFNAHMVAPQTIAATLNGNVQGMGVGFAAAGLPATMTAGVNYWLRYIDVNTFSVHTSEFNAGSNIGAIDFTGCTPALMSFSVWGSANDGSAILADFVQGRAAMLAQGMNGSDYYAANQSAYDQYVEPALKVMNFKASYTALAVNQFQPAFATNPLIREQISTTVLNQFGIRLSGKYMQCAGMVSTDTGSTELIVRKFVRSQVAAGCIFQNVMHEITDPNQIRLLVYYLDEIKYWSDAGMLFVGTAAEVGDATRAVRYGG